MKHSDRRVRETSNGMWIVHEKGVQCRGRGVARRAHDERQMPSVEGLSKETWSRDAKVERTCLALTTPRVLALALCKAGQGNTRL